MAFVNGSLEATRMDQAKEVSTKDPDVRIKIRGSARIPRLMQVLIES